MSGKQVALLAFIAQYCFEHGWAPSFREMQEALSLSSISQVAYHLTILAEGGYVRHQVGQSRALALTPKGQAVANGIQQEAAG